MACSLFIGQVFVDLRPICLDRGVIREYGCLCDGRKITHWASVSEMVDKIGVLRGKVESFERGLKSVRRVRSYYGVVVR